MLRIQGGREEWCGWWCQKQRDKNAAVTKSEKKMRSLVTLRRADSMNPSCEQKPDWKGSNMQLQMRWALYWEATCSSIFDRKGKLLVDQRLLMISGMICADHSNSSKSTLANHVLMNLTLCTGALQCWNRFGLASGKSYCWSIPGIQDNGMLKVLWQLSRDGSPLCEMYTY